VVCFEDVEDDDEVPEPSELDTSDSEELIS